MNAPAGFRFFRVGAGFFWLAGFVLSAWPLWLWIKFTGPGEIRAARARWVQIMSRRALRILHCRVVTSGTVPQGGLVVANHLGYVDILALGSLFPCAFVSKREVRRWPVFGWIASQGGTVFVDRDARASAGRPLPEIEAVIDAGIPVVLFPEGTSSDGSRVLPFRTALLAVVERGRCPATPASLRYTTEDGRPNRQLAYHGDDALLSHLVAALGADRTIVQIAFGESISKMNRKELGGRLHATISESLMNPSTDFPCVSHVP